MRRPRVERLRYRSFVVGFAADSSGTVLQQDSPSRYEADVFVRLARSRLLAEGAVEVAVIQMKQPFRTWHEVMRELELESLLMDSSSWN